MEAIEEPVKHTNGFMNHLLKFDSDTKGELLNVLQYSILGLIPVILFNKNILTLFPAASEEKGNIELVVEIVGEITTIFLGIFIINRLITYIPTYSEKTYSSLNLIQLVLIFLIIILNFQTELATKVDILVERVMELWTGVPADNKHKEKSGKVYVSQPISGNQPIPTHQNSRADYLGAHNQLIADPNMQQSANQSSTMYSQSLTPPAQIPTQQTQPVQNTPSVPQSNPPNFDSMYQEPMAANDGMGAFAAF